MTDMMRSFFISDQKIQTISPQARPPRLQLAGTDMSPHEATVMPLARRCSFTWAMLKVLK